MASRKPSSQSSSAKKATDPLRAAKLQLEEEEKALLRKQEQARRTLEEAPIRMQQIKQKQREGIRIPLNNSTRKNQRTFGLPHDKFSSGAELPRRPRARKAERNRAKLQFVLFVLILAVILFMVWRSIPLQ